MTQAELERAIYEWAWGEVNPGYTIPTTVAEAQALPTSVVPIMWAYEDAPRPNSAYITLNVVGHNNIGRPYRNRVVVTGTGPTATGVQTSRLDRDITVSVQGYGVKDKSKLQTLCDSILKESVIDRMNGLGIVCRDVTGPKNVPKIIDNQPENRDMAEIVFGIAITVDDQMDWIETYEITETVLPPS